MRRNVASLCGCLPQEPLPRGPSSQENLYYFADTLSIEPIPEQGKVMPNEPQYVSATRSYHPSERRDVRRTIEHWLRIPGRPTRYWGQRFLICGGDAVEDAVFVTYGLGFARLLGLPQKAVTTTAFLQQIPELYRDMFSEGYSKVIIETGPVHLKGTFKKESTFEFYWAVFCR
jgi:hypothetical protein